MPLDDDLEVRLRAMRSDTDEFPPHSADLVQRSIARGRRMRLIRATRVAAVTAAFALITAGSTLMATDAFGIRGGDGNPDRLRAGASTRSTERPPSHEPSSISGQEMTHTLESLLPPGGTVSAASGRGSRSDGPVVWPTAQLTYSTEHGSSGIDITIARLESGTPADQQQGQAGCLPVEVRPYDKCTTEKLPGGAVLNTTRSFTYPNSATGQKRWYVVLTSPDGVQLTVQQFSGGGEKGSSSGADPLLSIAQLTSVVRSPVWERAIAAVPAPRGAPFPSTGASTGASTGKKRVPGARMTRVLKSHLPQGGTVSGLDSGDGMAQLIYDDGHGKNMVEADAQYDRTALLAGHMGCADVPGECEATTLADGTQVKKVRGPSEKGGSAVVWLVDTLRPDGRRVVAREVNSYAEAGPVTRPQPALSMDELLSLVLDKEFFTD
ncbi:hypothetical protein ACIOTI_33400 [Streptomyces sp. NPDC087843]|uniref:hypothetical protein n=1 Tax=Streptomyces sp. NPDC087843 TaxID=3365804 RepID=UPI003805B914